MDRLGALWDRSTNVNIVSEPDLSSRDQWRRFEHKVLNMELYNNNYAMGARGWDVQGSDLIRLSSGKKRFSSLANQT